MEDIWQYIQPEFIECPGDPDTVLGTEDTTVNVVDKVPE